MKPSAIQCSDLHLCLDTPTCRTDDFLSAQTDKLKFLRGLQEKYDCPILCSGDVFHHWKPSPELISYALENLPDGIIAIPGQHDLEAHNLSNIKRSGIYALAAAGKIQLLVKGDVVSVNLCRVKGFPWGRELMGIPPSRNNNPSVALIHKLVYQGKPPFPGAEKCGGTGKAILKQMAGFDLVISGDNHQAFTETYGDQILVNPGSFMRNTASQADHKPSVFLWYAETNEVERVFLPINKNVVSREHIEVKEEHDERIEAFVSSLRKNDVVEVGISYEEMMKRYIAENNISKPVEILIYEAMGL